MQTENKNKETIELTHIISKDADKSLRLALDLNARQLPEDWHETNR